MTYAARQSDCTAGPTRLRFLGRRPWLVMAFLALLSPLVGRSAVGEERSLILATTTSVRDSGLLEMLLPDFEDLSGVDVRVIAVGTGAALRMGREGDVDLLLTHAPSAEADLVEEGIVIRRTPFMENYFVIAGPAEDPAGIASAPSPIEAIRRIAESQAPWVSRDDDSGTHKREKSLFEAAGIETRSGWPGFERTGSGMGLSLQIAGELRAYILSDIGTFLAFHKRVDLKALSRPAESLKNIYSILQLDPTRFARPIASSTADELERYLVSPSTQDRIGRFGQERFGRALFTPRYANRNSPDSTTSADPELGMKSPVSSLDPRKSD